MNGQVEQCDDVPQRPVHISSHTSSGRGNTGHATNDLEWPPHASRRCVRRGIYVKAWRCAARGCKIARYGAIERDRQLQAQREGTSCSGVRCPNKRMLGGQMFCSYRAAHHRSCREEERQSSTPQNDRRAAQPPTYDDTLKLRPRNDRPRPGTRLRGTHVADGE